MADSTTYDNARLINTLGVGLYNFMLFLGGIALAVLGPLVIILLLRGAPSWYGG